MLRCLTTIADIVLDDREQVEPWRRIRREQSPERFVPT